MSLLVVVAKQSSAFFSILRVFFGLLKVNLPHLRIAVITMSQHDLKEIYWRSRRGMLELELKLVPFVRDCYPDLSAELQAAYVDMLAEEDWQIFDWVQGREVPQEPVLAELVGLINSHRGRL